MLAIVTATTAVKPCRGDAARHAADVPDVQDDVAQWTRAAVPVGVASDEANQIPASVTDSPALEGKLSHDVPA